MTARHKRFSQPFLRFAREYWIAIPILASMALVGIAISIFLPHTANYAEAVSGYKKFESPHGKREKYFQEAVWYLDEDRRVPPRQFTESEVWQDLGQPDFERRSGAGKSIIYCYKESRWREKWAVIISFNASGVVYSVGYNALSAIEPNLKNPAEGWKATAPAKSDASAAQK